MGLIKAVGVDELILYFFWKAWWRVNSLDLMIDWIVFMNTYFSLFCYSCQASIGCSTKNIGSWNCTMWNFHFYIFNLYCSKHLSIRNGNRWYLDILIWRDLKSSVFDVVISFTAYYLIMHMNKQASKITWELINKLIMTSP